MGILLTAVAGLVVWIVLWSVGVKSFDAFMLTTVMVLFAIAAQMLLPFLPGGESDEDRSGRWTPR